MQEGLVITVIVLINQSDTAQLWAQEEAFPQASHTSPSFS